MNTNLLYPLNLSLKDRKCLIIGFGEVGKRKLGGLLKSDADNIHILDVNKGVWNSNYPSFVKFEQRSYIQNDILSSFIVFAATSSKEKNRDIANICLFNNILCNCVTDPNLGNFQVPANVREGPLLATISTQGQSPALSRKWKNEIKHWLTNKVKQAWLIGKLRAYVLEQNFPQSENAKIFRDLTSDELNIFLENNEIDKISHWLEKHLPTSLNYTINLILEEYRRAFS